MSRIVTFGEIMLRLTPEGYERILQSNKFNAMFAGAEANVAVGLAIWAKMLDLYQKFRIIQLDRLV